MSKQLVESRRDFLRQMAAAGFVTLGSSSLVACGNNAGDRPSEPGGAAGDTDAVALFCNDPADLTDVEIQQRTALQYVELSNVDGELCSNCGQWEDPPAAGACGTCKVVPGAIHPDGHCSVWVAIEGA